MFAHFGKSQLHFTASVLHIKDPESFRTKGKKRLTNLPTVEGFVGGVRVVEEEHVDEGDEEAGGLPGRAHVIWEPLVEDEDDEVAEQAGHEDDLWDESQVDVQRLLEVSAKNHERQHNELKDKTTSDKHLSVELKSHRWLKRLRETPNSMWMTPRMTDIFILNEFRNVSLLLAILHIWGWKQQRDSEILTESTDT